MKNNINNLYNSEFEKDELLAIIANNLELDETRKEKMRTAYKAVNDVLNADPEFFKGIKVFVYEQGSLRIGTTVRPLSGKEFDLDIVLRINAHYSKYTPQEIYDELWRVLSNHETYRPLLEEKKRCVRINYNSDFHMDILPGCMITEDNERIMIAEDARRVNWSRTSPEGYANWFDGISKNKAGSFLLESMYNTLIKAEVETRELPKDVYFKTPLQRTVQIIKRYRDIFYNNKNEDDTPPVSSIVLTTMIAKGYQDETSIQKALVNAVKIMKENADDYRFRGVRFKVENPVDNHDDSDKRENFTDFWKTKHYESFVKFVEQLQKNVGDFLNNKTNETSYNNLFGSGFYKRDIQQQIKYEAIIKGDVRPSAFASGIVLTDAMGTINTKSGIKNDSHGFYAE
jgi:hypothetical protein